MKWFNNYQMRPVAFHEIFNIVAGRDDVLHLEVGEPDFPTPRHVVEAGIEAAKRGVGYTQTAGLLELREALTEKLKRLNELDYAPEQVLVTRFNPPPLNTDGLPALAASTAGLHAIGSRSTAKPSAVPTRNV